MPTFVYLPIAREATVVIILKINRADHSTFAHMTRRGLNTNVQSKCALTELPFLLAARTAEFSLPVRSTFPVGDEATDTSGRDQDFQLNSTLFEQIWPVE
jgi:hypothetical protein